MRQLTEQEISALSQQSCTAEDWALIRVSDDFSPAHIRNVEFFGQVTLGRCEAMVEVADGFCKHSAIRNVTLRNVAIGNDCLVENVGLINTSSDPEFGEGHILSVLNEAGDGNVMLYTGLTANIADLMIRNEQNEAFTKALRGMIEAEVKSKPQITTIGNNVRITNVTEITNCHIADCTVIDGAACVKSCTLGDDPKHPVEIGKGAICHDSVIVSDSAVLDNARVESCFVGEKSTVTGGFSAEASLFFANTFMNNGESCAAFCGPFSQSHHKGSLLIGSEMSFYNAGSSTNFSNHAYKMGPMHWGILERGTKTASGSHTLLPAKFGVFNVILGKIQNHPDTTDLPFSYVIADGHDSYVVPGRNITTVGLYRDIRKWPKRDKRKECRTLINFDWLSPLAINEILKGKEVLTELSKQEGDVVSYRGSLLRRSSITKGLKYYDLALRLYFGALGDIAAGGKRDAWVDLCGMLLPASVEADIVTKVATGQIASLTQLKDSLSDANARYNEYVAAWADPSLVVQYGGDYRQALTEWVNAIQEDAEREYALGDVVKADLDHFVAGLRKELD